MSIAHNGIVFLIASIEQKNGRDRGVMVAESWDVVYERIRRRFVCVVGGWVESIACDLDAMEITREAAGGLPALFRRLHDLAGSSGTYGMHGVSTRASDAVMVCRRALDRDAVLTVSEIQRLRELLEAIREELEADPETARGATVDDRSEEEEMKDS